MTGEEIMPKNESNRVTQIAAVLISSALSIPLSIFTLNIVGISNVNITSEGSIYLFLYMVYHLIYLLISMLLFNMGFLFYNKYLKTKE